MELSSLRPLYERPGPWATVYLDASRNGENAAAEVELRWRALRESLAAQGADSSTVAALDDAVLGHERLPGNHGLALFCTDGRVAHMEVLTAPPLTDLALWDSLPHAMPLIAQRGEEIAWLRVIADRTGGDLTGVAAGTTTRAPANKDARTAAGAASWATAGTGTRAGAGTGIRPTGTGTRAGAGTTTRAGAGTTAQVNRQVSGEETFPIRKIKPGGWSQSRFQRAAEEAWHRNAGDTAVAAVQLADEIGAGVLVVGGDVRAAQLLVEQLPVRWRDRVLRTDAGSRAPGADNEPLDDVTARAVAEIADRHTRAALERFMIQYGNDAAAGSGLAAVVAALQRGQADTVLIVDDPSATGELWIGPEPTQLARDPDELRAMGVDAPRRTRADAALLRAIAMTDARLVLVGSGEAPLAGGVGAVLRYADASTRRR